MSFDTRDGIPDSAKEFKAPQYSLETNQQYLNFQRVEVTKIDESKPWKPALEVKITKGDGTTVEGLDANTPFFTFVDKDGNEMTVSAATSGHIDSLHIKGEDAGSKFDEPSLEDLFRDASAKMPGDIAKQPGISAFDVDMKKSMGKEGLASMQELLASGALTEADVAAVKDLKDKVKELNKTGKKEEKEAFIVDFKVNHSDCKIQFQLIRGEVLVPIVDAPKQETTKLFMAFGPDASGQKKTLYTAAPGRNMPRHPNPGQHTSREGVLDENTFDESANAWFDTVMLTGK